MLYEGTLGIILLPSRMTREYVIGLSKNIEQSALDLGGKHHPHLTLYHANFNALRESEIEEVMENIAASLPLQVRFFRIAAYAKKFVFWDAERTRTLISLHNQALGIARYLAPQAGAIGTENLDLSKEEKENIRDFGHPLVGKLWRPHITIGYREDGAEVNHEYPYDGWFDTIAFARIGEYGTAQEFLKTIRK